MTVLKPRYSIQQLSDKWKLPVSAIINHIEDGLLPIHCKTMVVTIQPIGDEDGELETVLLRADKEGVKEAYRTVNAYNLKHTTNVFPFTKPASITLGEDCLLEDDDIAKASIDGFSLCFVYKKHVDEFEKQFNLATNPVPLSSERPPKQSSTNEFQSANLLNVPKRRDAWFEVINDMTTGYFDEFNIVPNESQAWAKLWSAPPEGYSIKTRKVCGEDCLDMPGEKPLSKSAFKKRWEKYVDKKTQ